MTVEENLLTGAYTRKRGGDIAGDVEQMYERFPRLKERRTQQAGTMSGGEQQMLAFARALMSHPKIICMDEPTMGLSPKLVEDVLEQIAKLRDELGVSVLMVEQQAELACVAKLPICCTILRCRKPTWVAHPRRDRGLLFIGYGF